MRSVSPSRRQAVQVFHDMVLAGFCLNTMRRRVGYITQRLNAKDREALKALKSEDLQHWIK